jgi:hypothetical protein
MFNEIETRMLCAARPGTWTDIREMNCPPHIFQHVLENRARIMGFKAAPKVITDADRRAAAARTAALIAADTERANTEHERLLHYGRQLTF